MSAAADLKSGQFNHQETVPFWGSFTQGYAIASTFPDTLYETPPGRSSEQIERRTSNVQHRTSNDDDATLYRF
jgi:hypothetical protein